MRSIVERPITILDIHFHKPISIQGINQIQGNRFVSYYNMGIIEEAMIGLDYLAGLIGIDSKDIDIGMNIREG